MNLHPLKLLRNTLLPFSLMVILGTWHVNSLADTKHIIIESDSALDKEAARQSKEQWDSTRSLRNKVNARSEKNFDKVDKSIDLQDKCNSSYNVNAYWESSSNRCLDRRTGRPVTP